MTPSLIAAQHPLDLPLDWKAYSRTNSPATLQIRGTMISITPEAQQKLSDIVESQATAVGVRVSAVRGPHGCIHGWELGLDDRERPDDVVVVQGDLQILVDSGLAGDLRDAKIDYSEDGSVIGFSVEAPKGAPAGAHGGCSH